MDNQQFERGMEFILEQRAQFTSDIQQLRESQAQTDNVVARLAHVTLKGFKDVQAKIDALVDSQIRLTDSQARTDEELKITDEKLRKIIAVVDRYFERRNGNQNTET
jgi:hypothetical protein